MEPIQNYINGEFVEPISNEYIDVINPAIGEKYTVVANSNKKDIAYLFAWNHKQEIFLKEKNFTNNGGKWFSHVSL